MATTTTGLIDSKIVVNAYGQSAGGVWPNLRLLIDGVEAGRATVSSTTPNAYTFTAKVAPTVAHKVQVVYDNDATVNGQDRNLYVKSVVVNGNALAPTQATYDRYALDGQDVVAGQEGMWWQGTLSFSTPSSYYPAPVVTTPTPTAGASTITVNAQANVAGGVGAHFNLLVDGVKVGEGMTSATAKDYTFTTNAATGVGHKVQVQYDNDTAGRDLIVNKITINGKAHLPTESIVSYDKGALDGKDVVGGQAGLWWNGTLVVNASASDFPGTTTTPTTPPPAPSTPSLSVSDVTVAEPKATTGGTGIAPGFLHTEGGQIVDSSGQSVKLSGVNWFGAEGYAFAPQGLWMDSYQSHMNKMQALGFNVIRLPYSDAMLDAGRKPSGIDYSKNPDLVGKISLEVFDKIIDYADKIGMKIILDHHRSGDGASANENGLWYTSQYPEAKMIENWKMLATRYKGNDAVIGADLHNEPNGPATWGDNNMATDWARAAERIGNAIQTVNKDWLMIVEGVERYQNQWYWWGGNLLGQKNYDVKFNTPDKLVYSVHDYGPSLYMQSWFQDPNFPNNMPAKWDQMWGNFIQDDKYPVLVGEFGSKMETAIDRTWMPELVQYMNGDWNNDGRIDLAAGDQGASWTYWAWSPGSGDTGGIMDANWQVDTRKYDAIKAGLFKGTSAVPGQTDAVFTVKLSGASTTAVKVNYTTVDGTAKAGSDYTAALGTLTFNPGETSKTVAVKVLGDGVAEGTETFSLKLSAPTAATTLADDTGVGSITQTAAAAAAAVEEFVVAQATQAQAIEASQTVEPFSMLQGSEPTYVDALHDYDNALAA